MNILKIMYTIIIYVKMLHRNKNTKYSRYVLNEYLNTLFKSQFNVYD